MIQKREMQKTFQPFESVNTSPKIVTNCQKSEKTWFEKNGRFVLKRVVALGVLAKLRPVSFVEANWPFSFEKFEKVFVGEVEKVFVGKREFGEKVFFDWSTSVCKTSLIFERTKKVCFSEVSYSAGNALLVEFCGQECLNHAFPRGYSMRARIEMATEVTLPNVKKEDMVNLPWYKKYSRVICA